MRRLRFVLGLLLAAALTGGPASAKDLGVRGMT